MESRDGEGRFIHFFFIFFVFYGCLKQISTMTLCFIKTILMPKGTRISFFFSPFKPTHLYVSHMFLVVFFFFLFFFWWSIKWNFWNILRNSLREIDILLKLRFSNSYWFMRVEWWWLWYFCGIEKWLAGCELKVIKLLQRNMNFLENHRRGINLWV